jgi:type 1 glutamine amidotransferase
MPIPVLLCDPDGCACHTNAAAAYLLRHATDLRLRDGRLRAGSVREDQALRQAIASVAADGHRQLVTISSATASPLLLQVAKLSRRSGPSHDATVAVLVVDLSRLPPSTYRVIRRAFHLTPAEARLAVCLAEGRRLGDAAEHLAVSRNTAKTQLASIMLKTQTRGQAQLVRVLMLTATAGFRHDSIATARQVLSNLASTTREFTVTATEDLAAFSAANLANYDVIFFANTSGELPFSTDHKAAIIAFVSNGHGFLGTHSATDTLYEWADYGRLVGAYFKEHPWTQQATVVVENAAHPAASGIGERFTLLEEFYTFRDNPRANVQVLLRLDAASVGTTGDYPLAWAHSFGAGRVYYNALGHFPETWNDARFQRQLQGAIRWAAAR